ncbi:outer membrane protein assembly factor BamD [Verrucomicrobiota bacterium]
MQTCPWLSSVIFLVVVAWFLALAPPALAEDVVVTPNKVFRGRVTAADADSVTIEMLIQGRPQKVAVPRSIIKQLKVEPPPSIIAGIEAYEKGDWRKAKLSLEKVILNYQGLDVDWAQKGMVYFGRASFFAGDYPKAKRAFTMFLSTYPDHPLVIEARLGQAQIEHSEKNYETALEQFRALAETFDKQLRPASTQLPYAAEIYLGIGKCLDAQDDKSEALDAYVNAIAIYPAERFYPEALYRSSVISAELGKFDRATNCLSELIDKYPATEFARKGILLKNSIKQKKAAAEKKAD